MNIHQYLSRRHNLELNFIPFLSRRPLLAIICLYDFRIKSLILIRKIFFLLYDCYLCDSLCLYDLEVKQTIFHFFQYYPHKIISQYTTKKFHNNNLIAKGLRFFCIFNLGIVCKTEKKINATVFNDRFIIFNQFRSMLTFEQGSQNKTCFQIGA